MKKSFKQMTSLLLAGLMVFQSTPALAAAVDTTRVALSNVVATESTYVAGAVRADEEDSDDYVATSSDVEKLAFDKDYTYDEGDYTIKLSGNITLASKSVAAWASMSNAGQNDQLADFFAWEAVSGDEYLELQELSVNGAERRFVLSGEVAPDLPEKAETKVVLWVVDHADVRATMSVALTSEVEDDRAQEISFTEDEVTLEVGETHKLTVKATPNNASLEDLSYTSSDDEVVVVYPDGNIEAVAAGKATITATLERSDGEVLTATCVVTVKDETSGDLEDMIFIDPETMTLNVGEKQAIKVIASFSDASSSDALANVVFESTNKEVASVNENSEVVAWSEGETVIKAILKIGEETLTATCTVTVNATPVEDALDNILKSVENAFDKENPLSDENRQVVSDMVNAVAALDMDKETLNSEEVVAQIQEMEAFLTDNDFYGKTEVAASETAGVTLDVPVGLLLSLDPMTDAGKTPVLTATKVSESDVKVPSGNRRAYALDISVVLTLNGEEAGKVTDLRLPITLTTTVPATLTAAAERGRLNVYHYHGGNDVTPDKLAVTPFADGKISFQVEGFSTFVLAEAYTSGGSGSGGSGGGSGSRVVSSIPNLSGTWMQNEIGWWFALSSGGYVSNGWGRINNQWYYFNAEGYMATGWTQVAGVWYFLQPYGAMVENDWVFSGDNWYYLSASGAMVASDWVQYKDNWYYMTADGKMAVSTTTPDGFAVDANGVWVQ